MTIEFSCQACHKTFRVKDEYAGKRAKCQQCGAVMQVPDASSAASDDDDYQLSPVATAAEAAAAAAPSAASPKKRSAPSSSENLTSTNSDYQFEISQRPDFAMVSVRLQAGQKIFAEPGAMASMDPTVTMKSGFKGGFRKTLGRALGGESLLINTYTAEEAGEVTFAPGPPGDIRHTRLEGGAFYLQRGAFLLHGDGVELTGKWQGGKGFFSGQGLVLLKATGTGDLFFNSFGAILEVDVTDQYIVDTGYIVAFEDTLQYHVSVLPGLRAGSKLKTLFFGGEGLVCRFSGQGRVWIQTRHVQSFLSWVNPFRPTKSR